MARTGSVPDRHQARFRSSLLVGASAGAVSALMMAAPADAQLAAIRAALPNPAAAAAPAVTRAGSSLPGMTQSMQQVMARQAFYQARIAAQAGIVASANAAARQAAQAAAAAAANVADGLAAGGLKPVDLASQNGSPLTVWIGADQPTQATSGSTTNVTINQNQQRALLSWDSFNVGANTALTFNQRGNTDWVVVNRVTGGIDPATGLLRADPRPSQILGSIKADGTVFVLNRGGVLFGATAQVNLRSLVASSLELGAREVAVGSNSTRQLSLADRNATYLQTGILTGDQTTLVADVAGESFGSVDVASGARITSTGGFVILAAPRVSSAGEIKTAAGGQVSLEAGTQVDALVSTGAVSSVDRYTRGLVLASVGGGSVDVSGSIDAPQGYISLGTSSTGSVALSGILTSTTSVSRNGKIGLFGGTVSVAPNAVAAIAPETSSDTIPQSADSLANFKTSQIDIGRHATGLAQGKIVGFATGDGVLPITTLLPANISIGANSLLHAPGGDINLGGKAGERTFSEQEVGAASVKVDDGAVLNVSGVADFLVDSSRNQLEISPAKRNELRDTPTYRETNTTGDFTLNGATLYLDPRLSGVRSDGVAWIGSPLVEAASLAQQIGLTAPELLTRGGNITIRTAQATAQASASSISLASTASLDFAGGWIRYRDGFIKSSKLITGDGRIVDISQADPNDDYVAVANGFVEKLPQLSTPRVYATAQSLVSTFQQGYVEGRDAGTLSIAAPTGTIDAVLHGEASAGPRQIADAAAPTKTATLAGDVRTVQAANGQLPAGGLVRVSALLGGDILVGGAGKEAAAGTIRLSDSRLSDAKLSGLSLQTSGGATFASGSSLSLADGGALNVETGRAIRFAGTVNAPAGTITARTYQIATGSVFTTDDDLLQPGAAFAVNPTLAPGSFDILVDPTATLSVRGRWVNDLQVTDGQYGGGGYTSGGAITLQVAPRVVAYTDSTQTKAVDLSGSIRIAGGSLLDASGGGHVGANGSLTLDGKGGDVSLINESGYFQIYNQSPTADSLSDERLFGSDLTTFGLAGTKTAIVPDALTSVVDVAENTIRSFGFKGGGTFTLVTPDLAFGSSDADAGATRIPLDFLGQTGFATLDLTAWHTQLLPNVIASAKTTPTAILATQTVRIDDGETLDLTQSILNPVLNQDRQRALLALASGSDVSRLAEVAPSNTLGDFDNLAANLRLGGLTELDVLGSIVGAPGATITAPKLYNAGTIRIAGGTVTQRIALPQAYATRPAISVTPQADEDGVDRGAGFAEVFGPANADGRYDENALVTDPYQNSSGTLTVAGLLAGAGSDRLLYYAGRLGAGQGMLLAEGSTTDLSGISIRNPRAPTGADGQPIATGRVVAGGTIAALGRQESSGVLLGASGSLAQQAAFVRLYPASASTVTAPLGAIREARIDAAPGATINLSGASDTFQVRQAGTTYVSLGAWSDAGTLSALGGGSLAGASITARGGASSAAGGTIEWYNPILAQGDVAGSDALPVDRLIAAGFDRFVARGALSTLGDVTMTLGRAFQLASPDLTGVSPGENNPYFDVSVASTGNLSITAPHVTLASINQVPGVLPGTFVGTTPQYRATLTGTSSFDVIGGVGFGLGFDSVELATSGDLRLIGVQPATLRFNPNAVIQGGATLSGGLIVGGDLLVRAAQVYATTGTGNLQKATEGGTATPFQIGSIGGFDRQGGVIGKADAVVRFERASDATPAVPYSAGSYIAVLGKRIEQAGVLRAPLGRIDLGSNAQSITLGGEFISGSTDSVALLGGSVTSVSAEGLKIPYGTTLDLTSYLFTPTTVGSITSAPTAELGLAGGTIAVAEGATVNASGGGSLYAYEFTSGTGGSRDLLSRFNADPFSGNDGYLYPDQRQVYAILPAGSPQAVALYDPVYSDDYAGLYGSEVGRTVVLDASDDFAGGTYVLMPAKYALLPGALRIVENVGAAVPPPGASNTLRDGSVLVGGVFGVSGTGIQESQRRSFTIQDQATFRSYSNIVQTDIVTALGNAAQLAGKTVPTLPNDAARIVIDPVSGLTIGSRFNTAAATGGRGSQVDILGHALEEGGKAINIVSTLDGAPDDALNLRVADLVGLNANSLLIGGRRTERVDGSTLVDVGASQINVLNDAANPLTAPEIILATRGSESALTVGDGAAIVATGALSEDRSGTFDLTVAGDEGARLGTIGAFFRVSNGGQRNVDFDGGSPATNRDNSVFRVGNATITGQTADFVSSRNLSIAAPTLALADLTIASDRVAFSTRSFGVPGAILSRAFEAALANVGRLTVRSANAVSFTQGTHSFNDLAIDAPGIRLLSATTSPIRTPQTLTLQARDLTIGNSGAATAACTLAGPLACGVSGSNLVVQASGVHFVGGTVRTSYGFDAGVAITATGGMDYSGSGTFDTGAASLALVTPFLVDRGSGAVPTGGVTPVSLTFATTGAISVAAPEGATVALPGTPLAPGAKLSLGTVDQPASAVSISGSAIRATAGSIDVEAAGDISLAGGASLQTPSYSQSFGDASDRVVASANGGTVSLVTRTGNIDLASGTHLVVGGATGAAGAVNLIAADGTIDLHLVGEDGSFDRSRIDAGAPGRGASLAFDAGRSGFDLSGFVTNIGQDFTGDLSIRSGVGDLVLGAGQTLRVASLSLTGDGGSVLIDGTVDASGVNGGDISLFGRDRVAIGGGALIDAHSTGYSATDASQASAGDVLVGVGEAGRIDVADGARFQLGVANGQARLIPHQQFDPRSNAPITAYTYVEADKGGTLTLRAPVVSNGVPITFAGAVDGARDVTVEGYRVFRLDQVNANRYSGVSIANGVATLDAGASEAGKVNFLSGRGNGTIVNFVQNFDIAGSRANLGSLASLAAYHERPGVELAYSGDITLASNWNLAAGTVNVQAAVRAGDMRVSDLVGSDGSRRYEVVAGREADLLQNFTTMLYRVGGRADGAAGVLTLRAGGNLELDHSISDGFFSFGDQTDPDFLNYALGGGDRQYHPTLTISCGGADCSDTEPFVLDTTHKTPQLPPIRSSISLNLTRITRGDEVVLTTTAPYSAAANSAAAVNAGDGGGDPLGSATMFPLLPDGSAMDSFSLRLTGGTGATASANPLHVDRASGGSVIVKGSSSYSLDATEATGRYTGAAQLAFGGEALSGDLLQALSQVTGLGDDAAKNAATSVSFGTSSEAATSFMRRAARSFFAKYRDQVQFVGPADAPTGFAAPLALVTAFLQSTDGQGRTVLDRFGAMIQRGAFDYSDPQPIRPVDVPGTTAEVRTVVRTGTGSIAIAAAGDVDLTNGPSVSVSAIGNKASDPSRGAQRGGAAVYTVGQAFKPGAVDALVVGTGETRTIDPAAYLAGDVSADGWLPNVAGRLLTQPVWAHDGGSISIAAGGDVLGRRDVWSETFYANGDSSSYIGTADQRWRVGLLGTTSTGDTTLASNIRINPQQFSSGVATLGGGDVSIAAGGSMSEMTLALDTTITVGDVGDSFGQMIFGGGNLDVRLGGDLRGGRIDVSSGLADVVVGGSVGAVGAIPALRGKTGLDVRLTDAALSITAGGRVDLASVGALGVNVTDTENARVATPNVDLNGQGYFLDQGGLSVVSGGTTSIGNGRLANYNVLPPRLEVTSFQGDIDLSQDSATILFPSTAGNLSLLAGGTLNALAIDLEDSDPSVLPGVLSAYKPVVSSDTAQFLFGRPFSLPAVLPTASDSARRLLHNSTPTHLNDPNPARIAVGGSLNDLTLFLSKAGRISAGGDIVNMIFVGQNVGSGDVTRITAGRDITATTAVTNQSSPGFEFTNGRQTVGGNLFVIGGGGSFFLEAGRNMGPFLNSATISNFQYATNGVSQVPGTSDYAGGILAVGNDYNPWLAPKSADIYAFFGVAKGMNFDALRDYYLNPANFDVLDGDLFEQNVDQFGNKTPDRSRPIYPPILIAWLRANAPDTLAGFGSADVTAAQAYAAFASLPELTQRRFLLDRLYFSELAAPSDPNGNSYLQYVRGYRAVDLLFPATFGYTKNDLSGTSNGGSRVATGNLDLRLAAIETTRDSNITILGPGGDALVGSITRTSAQAASRAYQPDILGAFRGNYNVPVVRPGESSRSFQLQSVPIGYEGVLTLRGGTIHGFADGDVRLNQSRLFSQQSGDITLWSSNGDLNAGQGPKSAASVPPIVLRFNPNGGSEVDAAGGVVGAGIAGFAGLTRQNGAGGFDLIDATNDPDAAAALAQLASLDRGATVTVNGKTYQRALPTITLVAPAGTVDAGDAGVRASGDIFVAAARVANADNFKVGGTSVGIPSVNTATAPVLPASAASALVANVFRTSPSTSGDQRSLISVDVLGYFSGNADDCKDAGGKPAENCTQQ